MSLYLQNKNNQVGHVYIQPPYKMIITDDLTIYSGDEDSFVQIVLDSGKINIFKDKIIVEGTKQYLTTCQFWEFIIRDVTFKDYFKSKLILNNHLVIMKGNPISYYLTSRGDRKDDWDLINTVFDKYNKMKAFW